MEKEQKITEACRYLENINRKWFKLDINTVCVPYSENQFTNMHTNGYLTLAYYSAKKFEGYRYGTITFNCETMMKMNQEQIYELVRHEYAHAVVDLKYDKHNEGGGHGKTWIMIAKLMRVNTKRYELE